MYNFLTKFHQIPFFSKMKKDPQWLPIADAPKDGTLIVLLDKRGNFKPYVGSWKDGWKRTSDGAGDFYPTHWCPIPK